MKVSMFVCLALVAVLGLASAQYGSSYGYGAADSSSSCKYKKVIEAHRADVDYTK